MDNLFFLETLAHEKIAEARAEAARERRFHAAGQPGPRRGDGGFFGLLRSLRALLAGQPGRSSENRTQSERGR